MKKNLLLIACVALLVACGGNNKAETETSYSSSSSSSKEDTVTTAPVTTEASFEEGKKLIASSDCLACHQEKQKLVGPAYEEVAQKYELNDKNTAYLADKIIKGGSGVWGQVPMSPHPDLKEADAKEMARYILSLRK